MSADNRSIGSDTYNIEDGQEVMSDSEQPEVSQVPSADQKQITITINRAWAKVAAFMLAGFLGFIAGAFVTKYCLDGEHSGGRHHGNHGGHSRMHQFDYRFGQPGPGGMMPDNGQMMPGDGMGLRDCPDDMPMVPSCLNKNDSPVNPEDSTDNQTPAN